MKKNFCTYFDSAYLLKGMALHASLERHAGEYHLWVLALDDRVKEVMAAQPNVSVISLESFETIDLKQACHDRSVQERYWTYTPWWIKFVLDRGPVDHIAYIDADCFFFDSPSPVFDEMKGKGVAITPHRFPPKYMSMIGSGIYNVGMVYVERDNQRARDCINEWAMLCKEWCYYRFDKNNPYRFCDQKYWDMLAPKYSAYAIQHLGANLAPWNAEGYQYAIRDNKLFVNNQPLIWYHFHGYRMSPNGLQNFELWPTTYTLPKAMVNFVYGAYELELLAQRRKVYGH